MYALRFYLSSHPTLFRQSLETNFSLGKNVEQPFRLSITLLVAGLTKM